MFLPALAAVLLLSGGCCGSDENVTTTAMAAVSVASSPAEAQHQSSSEASAWTADEYATTVVSPTVGNDTAAQQPKPSKFDEHVEDWQYVDNPLKNITGPAESSDDVSTALQQVCKTCGSAKSTGAENKPRNKRNHDVGPRRFKAKLAYHQSLGQLYAIKQSYRRKRFRRSAVAAYPNGAIRPYGHYQQQQQQFAVSADPNAAAQSLARRRRYRYATYDPSSSSSSSAYYQQHYQRPQRTAAAVTPWDRPAAAAEFRRRYLRFPPTHDAPPPGAVVSGVPYNSPWSLDNGPSIGLPPPPLSAQLPSFGYHSLPPPPPTGPRSPRLVFRDPVDPGTLQAPYGSNGLQDLLVSPPDDVKGQCPRARFKKPTKIVLPSLLRHT